MKVFFFYFINSTDVSISLLQFTQYHSRFPAKMVKSDFIQSEWLNEFMAHELLVTVESHLILGLTCHTEDDIKSPAKIPE